MGRLSVNLFRFGYIYRYTVAGAAGGIMLVMVLVFLSAAMETQLFPFENLIEVAVAFAALGAFCGASYGAYKLGE